jgi:gliding motility-associated-like protein
MKKYFLSIILISFALIAIAQTNLVINPSFELCPITFPVCDRNPEGSSPPWKHPTPSSPDLFRKCDPDINFRWPKNGVGFCYPRTDTSYAGFVLFDKNNYYYREYLQGKLQSKLKANKKYCVSFYVQLSDYSNYAVDAIGMYISDTAVHSNVSLELNYTAQIANPKGNIINDTANWVLISGIYTAYGGEEYITIGNFLGNTIDTVPTGAPPTWNPPYSYYYLDDVSVIEITEAEAGQNKTICKGDTASIGEQSKAGIIYNWLPAAGLSSANVANPKASPSVTTTYYLTVTDTATACGTFVTKDSVVVAVSSFQFSVSGSKSNVCAGESVVLNASGGINYAWSGGLGAGSTVVVSPSISTIYTVSVTDSTNCRGVLSKEIKVINCDTTTNIEVPNVLTPNADGKNDEFKIKHKGEFENFNVKIFNRWGVKIFESQNINFTWDARTNSGYVMPNGTYYYIISAKGKDGKEWELHGSVSVLR